MKLKCCWKCAITTNNINLLSFTRIEHFSNFFDANWSCYEAILNSNRLHFIGRSSFPCLGPRKPARRPGQHLVSAERCYVSFIMIEIITILGQFSKLVKTLNCEKIAVLKINTSQNFIRIQLLVSKILIKVWGNTGVS